ncbi:MAG: class I SAM-dependent methyltransferase [Thermogutta sp.]|nr:class I SAM-dependent methyltransferase [Thermogutta sp.]
MNGPSGRRGMSAMDWDVLYRETLPPWEVGFASPELNRILDEWRFPKGTVLDLGCGTGADAVCLAQHGFDVTAVDFSPTAVERARTRAQNAAANVCFVLEDVFRFGLHAGVFDVVYDGSFYQYVRQWELNRLLDLLWRITKPGSFYICITKTTPQSLASEPPPVSEDDLRSELGRLFELVQIREFAFDSRVVRKTFSGISAVMRRPVPASIVRT